MEENKKNQTENLNNENVPMPDYKKLYEEKAASLADAQDCINRLNEDNKRLEDELADAKDKIETKSKYHLQFYRQTEILKKALRSIMEKNDIKIGDVYEMLLESNDIDLDALLLYLSK